MDVFVLVPPLPIVSLFPLACLFPVVVFLVMLFQILMPRCIFPVIPLMFHFIVVVLSAQSRHRREQTYCQH